MTRISWEKLSNIKMLNNQSTMAHREQRLFPYPFEKNIRKKKKQVVFASSRLMTSSIVDTFTRYIIGSRAPAHLHNLREVRNCLCSGDYTHTGGERIESVRLDLHRNSRLINKWRSTHGALLSFLWNGKAASYFLEINCKVLYLSI